MTIRTLLLLVPLALFLGGCGGGSPFSGPTQTRIITLEIGQVDLINQYANNPKSALWDDVIAETNEAMYSSESDALIAFEQAWEKHAAGQKMITIFYNRKYAEKFDKSMSNAEVLATLRNEIEEAARAIQKVLEKRMENFGASGTVKYNMETQRFEVEISSEAPVEDVRKLLTSTANLEFYETYELKELTGLLDVLITVYDPVVEIEEPELDTAAIMAGDDWTIDQEVVNDSMSVDELLTSDLDNESDSAGTEEAVNTFYEIFQPAIFNNGDGYDYSQGCLVGLCDVNNKAKVTEMLQHKEVVKAGPRDLVLMWGANPEQNYNVEEDGRTYFGLYAIKVNRNGSGAMQGNDISDARSGMDGQTGQPEVTCTFTPAGSRRFAELTEKNLKKAIAIVVDGEVWSAPIVQEKIGGGSVTISGQTDMNESYSFAVMLRAGALPAPVRIVDERVPTN